MMAADDRPPSGSRAIRQYRSEIAESAGSMQVMNTTSMFESIVTHAGRAHRDELYACALLLAVQPKAALARRNPTAAELDDARVVVVDVGGHYEPERLNFDHHQFARDAEPTCALTLVLRWMGLEDVARAFWPWLEGLEWLDSRGPTATAQRFTPGTAGRDGLLRMAAPAEDWMLRQFEAGDLLSVRGVGEMLLNDLRAVEDRFRVLNERAVWMDVEGLPVLDTRDAIPADQRPEFGVEAWYHLRGRTPAIIVAHSPRDAGATNLVRVNDHPRVDFRRLAGYPGVSWIHANGFLASAQPANRDALVAMVRLAVLPV